MKIELSPYELSAIDAGLLALEDALRAELARVFGLARHAVFAATLSADYADVSALRTRLHGALADAPDAAPICWNCSSEPCWCGAAAEVEQDLYDRLG